MKEKKGCGCGTYMLLTALTVLIIFLWPQIKASLGLAPDNTRNNGGVTATESPTDNNLWQPSTESPTSGNQTAQNTATESPTSPSGNKGPGSNPYGYIDTGSRFKTLKGDYSYNNLTNDSQRNIYSAFLESSEKVTGQTQDGYYLTEKVKVNESSASSSFEENAAMAYRAFLYDNPQIFWCKRYAYFREWSGSSDVTTVYLFSYCDAGKLGSMKSALNSKLNSIIGSIPDGLSEYELEKYIHDYLIDNCVYNTAIQNALDSKDEKKVVSAQENNPHTANAYGAIVEGNAVCEGYSRAFQLICSCAGMECVSISGNTAKAVNASYSPIYDHVWNAAKCGGDWYLVDSTWDDNDSGAKETQEAFEHRYFNVTTKKMSESRTWPVYGKDRPDNLVDCNLFVPECTAVKYNYYRYDKDCCFAESLDGDPIKNAFADAAKNGSNTVTVCFDPDKFDVDKLVDTIFNDGYYDKYLDYAKQQSGVEFDSRCTYYTMSEVNVMVFVMKVK